MQRKMATVLAMGCLAALTFFGPRVAGPWAMADTVGTTNFNQGGSEPILGEIRAFGFGFAPRGWAKCDGSLLPISQNTALFSLIGTTYGGDGEVTFALPDLRGRAPIHEGRGPGLTDRSLGEKGGAENVALNTNQIPAHSHDATMRVLGQSGPSTLDPLPSGKVLARGNRYSEATADTDLGASSVVNSSTGGGQPHPNMQPYLAINYCIAVTGLFPSESLDEAASFEPKGDWRVEDISNARPATHGLQTRLLQSSPNPFHPSTMIRFSLASTDRVELSIYDVNGRKIRTLLDEVRGPGSHEVAWDGSDEAGRELSAGVYWSHFSVSAQGVSSKGKMVLLKNAK